MLDDKASHEPTSAARDRTADLGALTVVPRDLRGVEHQADQSEALERREPTMESALVLDEQDAERVAFAMWRDGRADDAIAFLEREILLERDRLWKRHVFSNREDFSGRKEPRFGDPAPTVIVTPPLDEERPQSGRKRRREAMPVSEPVFSDSSAPLIELSAQTVAASSDEAEEAEFVSPPMRMGSGPAIVAAVGLVIVGIAAAANFWHNHRSEAKVERAATAVTVEPAATGTEAPPPVIIQATPTAATEDPPAQDAVPLDAAPPPEPTTDMPPAVEPDGAATDVDTPPETEAEPDHATAAPAVPEGAVALYEPGHADEVLDDPTTPPEDVGDAALQPEPEATVARLPRGRPEPPAGMTFAPPSPASIQPPVSHAAPRGAIASASPRAADLPNPFYGADGSPQRETLTPAEYQALLERRALAEEYVARRHAEQPVPIGRPILLPLLRHY
jgi:hypothetical protein